MGIIVDENNKTVLCNVATASKKDMKLVKELQQKGYQLLKAESEAGGAKAMPHNMGIHMDNSLHF